jgi:hypothetical protein
MEDPHSRDETQQSSALVETEQLERLRRRPWRGNVRHPLSLRTRRAKSRPGHGCPPGLARSEDRESPRAATCPGRWTLRRFRVRHRSRTEGNTEIGPPESILDREGTSSEMTARGLGGRQRALVFVACARISTAEGSSSNSPTCPARCLGSDRESPSVASEKHIISKMVRGRLPLAMTVKRWLGTPVTGSKESFAVSVTSDHGKDRQNARLATHAF